jgi:hypothetical protein
VSELGAGAVDKIDGRRRNGRCNLWTETTMPNPHLPAETLDHIADFLHDSKHTLWNCCLVSKSWIPRTRKHLFAEISFTTKEELQTWKKTFPDPLTSPACYTKTLIFGSSHTVTAADAVLGGWITGFSRVVHFRISGTGLGMLLRRPTVTLVSFHGFSPLIKSLHVNFTCGFPSKFFDLVLSFPLLEDLEVIVETELNELPTTTHLSNLPPFTGSLKLLGRGMKPIAHRLLSLPRGIHFRKLTLGWFDEEDLTLITRLVVECIDTLESLNIFYHIRGKSIGDPLPH